MTRALGKNQLTLLKNLMPGRAVVIGDKTSSSLTQRGLAQSWDENGKDLVTITPAGLRALADEMEAGRIGGNPKTWLKKT
jgi:hypothetical protein